MDTWSIYGLLLYFVDIWYNSWKFGIFFILVLCAKKNLATLVGLAKTPSLSSSPVAISKIDFRIRAYEFKTRVNVTIIVLGVF
jgi:hypothetical protein